MRCKPILDQYSRLMIRSGSRQGVKHVLYLVQADLRIGATSLRTREVPFGNGVGGPGASMRGSWPDNQWARDLPSAETHSIAVTKARLTPAPLQFPRSCILTRTLRELRTLNRTPVSSIL
jgi:hypothetical protein